MCASVIEGDRSCHVSVSSTPVHIMRSFSSSNTLCNCGSMSHPWTLEAPAGQQINVSLLDFGLQQRAAPNQQHCSHHHGYILDKTAPVNKNISICGLGEERNRIVYQSSSNAVDIILQNPSIEVAQDESRPVLLGFTGLPGDILFG